jgi:hypothetical protein
VCNEGVDDQRDAAREIMGLLPLLDQSTSGSQALEETLEPDSAQPQLSDRKDISKTKRNKRKPKQIKCTKLTFLDLPREVRDMIYFLVIRPDCGLGAARRGRNSRRPHNHIGTTKILCLNQQIYKEAMGLILATENLLTLRDDGGKMFRNMIDFGKPLFFYGSKAPRCRIPQQYCGLNLIGMRYLTIDIRYPLSGKGDFFHPRTGKLEQSHRSYNYDVRMAALMKSALEVEAVLRKCTSLETLRLILQTDSRTFWDE